MFFENCHLNPKILTETKFKFLESIWLDMGADEGRGGPASTVRQIHRIRHSRTPGPKGLGRQSATGRGAQAQVPEPAVFLIHCLAEFTEDKLFQNNKQRQFGGGPALCLSDSTPFRPPLNLVQKKGKCRIGIIIRRLLFLRPR